MKINGWTLIFPQTTGKLFLSGNDAVLLIGNQIAIRLVVLEEQVEVLLALYKVHVDYATKTINLA